MKEKLMEQLQEVLKEMGFSGEETNYEIKYHFVSQNDPFGEIQLTIRRVTK